MTSQDLENHIKQTGLNRRDWYHIIYLKSDHWKDLRRQKFEESGKFCEVCKTKNNIQVHHLRYRNIYDVQTSDLQVLCRKHHKDQHPEHRKRQKQRKQPVQRPAKFVARSAKIIERSEIAGIIRSFRFPSDHVGPCGRRTVPKPMSESVERNLRLFYNMVLKERKKVEDAIRKSKPTKSVQKRERTLAIAEQRFRNYVNSLPDYVCQP